MRKKNVKNLALTKKTISRMTADQVNGGAAEGASRGTVRPLPMTNRYSNCASYCYECQ